MGSSPMEKIGDCNGLTLYFADSRFEKPGVYYWDGTDNVRVWPKEETAAQSEINALRAELARIEENGTPWVPELLEWLEKHDCCPELPFTDYELIESLEARFGNPNPPQPSASVRERAREILAGEVASDYPKMARALVAGKSMESYVLVPHCLRAIESALSSHRQAGDESIRSLHARFMSDTSGLSEEWQDWRNDFARDIRALVEKGAGNG